MFVGFSKLICILALRINGRRRPTIGIAFLMEAKPTI
jgi:hypothetical protein